MATGPRLPCQPAPPQIAHKFFRAPKRAPALAELGDDAMAAARAEAEAEAVNVRIAAENAEGRPLDADAYGAVWAAVASTHAYLPTSRTLVPRAEAAAGGVGAGGAGAPADLLSSLQHTFETLAGAFNREQARLAKVEARVSKLQLGFEARAAKLGAAMAAGAAEGADKAIEVAAYARLAADEAAALPARLARAQAEAQEEADRERALQARYAALMREMDTLQTALAGGGSGGGGGGSGSGSA
jgi:hypothetical protein